MKNYYRVIYETADESKIERYYISTSISMLLYSLGYNGADVGSIVEIKRVARLPRGKEATTAM